MKAAGLDATKEISMGKVLAGQLLTEVAGGCVQMCGGLGFMNEMIISRYFRDARGLPIAGGAEEVMLNYIADSDEDAIRKVKTILSYIPLN